MKPSGIRELQIIECWAFQQGGPGFALPLLAHPTDSHLRMVQEIDEIDEHVSGFRILDGEPGPEVISVVGPSVKIGDQIVHAFVLEDREITIGSLETLGPILKAFVERCPENSAVVLQIVEMIGTDQEKKHARSKMRDSIASRAGASAASAFYEGSTLRAALWKRLIASAPNSETAQRILRARSRLSAQVGSNGEIKADLTALTTADRAHINEEALTSELAAEFDVSSILVTDGTRYPDLEAAAAGHSDPVDALIRKVKAAARQEERFAILAKAILEDRKTGLTALGRYKRDKGRITDWALRELRSRLKLANSHATDELMIANIIPYLMSRHYSLSRGEMLYYLAMHLARWPKLNLIIRENLERWEHSGNVSLYKDRIEQLLKNGPPWVQRESIGWI